MSETPEPEFQPAAVATAPPLPPPLPPQAKPPGLYTAAALVVIVAGILFILSVVFFTGAMVFSHNHRCIPHGVMFGPGAGPGPGPWNGPWGPGPGEGPRIPGPPR